MRNKQKAISKKQSFANKRDTHSRTKRLLLIDDCPLSQSGQTLVEVSIAIAVLALAFVSAGALATTTIRTTTESGRRTQATALATRELESLRTLQIGLAEQSSDPNTLLEELEDKNITQNGNCYSFTMQRDTSVPSGWRFEGTTSYGSLIAYQSADFSGGDFPPNYENFARVVLLCRADDVIAAGGGSTSTSTSEFLYDVAVTVQWREASQEKRQLTYRTVLSTPLGATYE